MVGGVGGDHAVFDEHRGLVVDRVRRQPWIVQGLQKTVNANSPSVSATEIWISLIVFVLAYIVLGAADLVLMLRYSRHGLPQPTPRRRSRAARPVLPSPR